MMKAGALNRRIKIQKLATGKDAAGQNVTTWVDVAYAWANIRHGRGTEALRNNTPTSVLQASIRIRLNRSIDTGMRVYLRDGTTYNIMAVAHDEMSNDFTTLVCELVK